MSQLEHLATLGHVPAHLTFKTPIAELLKARNKVAQLNDQVAKVEIDQLVAEAQARYALFNLCKEDVLYKDTLRYMMLGHPLGGVMGVMMGRSGRQLTQERIYRIIGKLDYFNYEPYSVTIARIFGDVLA